MKRGWFQQKQQKLKKCAIESRKESMAISLIDEGHAGLLTESVQSRILEARARARQAMVLAELGLA